MSNEVPIGKRLCRLLLVKLPLSLIALSLVWVLVLKWCPVLVTPLMVQRSIAYRSDKEGLETLQGDFTGTCQGRHRQRGQPVRETSRLRLQGHQGRPPGGEGREEGKGREHDLAANGEECLPASAQEPGPQRPGSLFHRADRGHLGEGKDPGSVPQRRRDG